MSGELLLLIITTDILNTGKTHQGQETRKKYEEQAEQELRSYLSNCTSWQNKLMKTKTACRTFVISLKQVFWPRLSPSRSNRWKTELAYKLRYRRSRSTSLCNRRRLTTTSARCTTFHGSPSTLLFSVCIKSGKTWWVGNSSAGVLTVAHSKGYLHKFSRLLFMCARPRSPHQKTKTSMYLRLGHLVR